LWVRWILANVAGVVLASVAGLILAFALGTEWETVAATRYFFWVYAFLLGTGQWLILRQRGFRYPPWVVTTVGGALLYSVVITATWDPVWSRYSGIWVAVATLTLYGAAIGMAQWLYLRKRFSGAGWWILATAAGFALATVLEQASACFRARHASAWGTYGHRARQAVPAANRGGGAITEAGGGSSTRTANISQPGRL
jgi:hypothetical protein